MGAVIEEIVANALKAPAGNDRSRDVLLDGDSDILLVFGIVAGCVVFTSLLALTAMTKYRTVKKERKEAGEGLAGKDEEEGGEAVGRAVDAREEQSAADEQNQSAAPAEEVQKAVATEEEQKAVATEEEQKVVATEEEQKAVATEEAGITLV